MEEIPSECQQFALSMKPWHSVSECWYCTVCLVVTKVLVSLLQYLYIVLQQCAAGMQYQVKHLKPYMRIVELIFMCIAR